MGVGRCMIVIDGSSVSNEIWAIILPHVILIHGGPRCLEGKFEMRFPLFTKSDGRYKSVPCDTLPYLTTWSSSGSTNTFFLVTTGTCVCMYYLPF